MDLRRVETRVDILKELLDLIDGEFGKSDQPYQSPLS